MEFEQQVGALRYGRRGEEHAWTSATARTFPALRHADGHDRFGGAAPSQRQLFPVVHGAKLTRSEKRAIIALVQEAIISGVSTRKIYHKLAGGALGITSISKSVASEYFKELDEEACAFRERLLTGKYPYLFLDAVYEKVRIGRTVVIAGGASIASTAYVRTARGNSPRLRRRPRHGERGELDDVSPWTARAWPCRT